MRKQSYTYHLHQKGFENSFRENNRKFIETISKIHSMLHSIYLTKLNYSTMSLKYNFKLLCSNNFVYRFRETKGGKIEVVMRSSDRYQVLPEI